MFEELPSLASSVLTIGFFDGVHLGHQALLKRAKENCGPNDTFVVLTFSNHPSTLFQPNNPTPLIIPLAQKLFFLKQQGNPLILTLALTQTLANTPYDLFLENLHSKLHFHTLVLGKGAKLGKGRIGDEEKVKILGDKLGFKATYIEKKELGGTPLSSALIRTLVAEGRLTQVSHLLGRPYSLFGTTEQDDTSYYAPFPGLCLPPSGRYPLKIKSRKTELVFSCEGWREADKIRWETDLFSGDVEIEFSD